MEETLISFETAKLAKEKGFDIYSKKVFVETLEHSIEIGRGGDCIFPYQAPRLLNSGKFDEWDIVHCKAPTQSLLQKWLREKHKIEVYILPIFREKCSYDSFKRDGFSFTIIRTEPCLYLDYTDFNMSGEDRDDLDAKDNFNNTFTTYEQALEAGLQEGLNLMQ